MSAVRLAHRVTDGPAGPPVVLLHGLGETAGTWERFALELAGSRTSIALDLRGHGASPRPGVYTVDPPARPPGPLNFDWELVAPMRRALRAPNPLSWQGVERLAIPTLWISGGPASHLDPARVAEAATAMPNATTATVPVGHLVHDDAPDDFARLVIPFLSADGEPPTP